MVFSSNKLIKLIKKKAEFTFLLLLLLFTITSTTFYNNNKIVTNINYKNTINNIYFQKSINQIFNNLTPRYKSINHKISKGETFDKILNSYSISNDEIIEVKKELTSNYNLNDLKIIIFSNISLKINLESINSCKFDNYVWFNI